MRTINADEALRMIRNSKQDCPYHRNSYEATAWREAHDCAISCVEAAPTIAEPVKHGQWEETLISFHDCVTDEEWDEFCYEHKECGYQCDFEFNFCPNCGAKMDGEREDT